MEGVANDGGIAETCHRAHLHAFTENEAQFTAIAMKCFYLIELTILGYCNPPFTGYLAPSGKTLSAGRVLNQVAS